jgi:hypothetical protein
MPRLGRLVGRTVWGADSPLRQALRWVVAEREEIDQEGLLAERTLCLAPPRPDDERDAERRDRRVERAGDAAR